MRSARRGRTHPNWIAALAGAALVLCAVAAAQADTAGRLRATLVAEGPSPPIYDPASKSYFELHQTDVGLGGKNWAEARALAAGLFFRGVRGRLAIVKSQATHDFLRNHFDLKTEAWIGLRYWCSFRKLQWVDGEMHSRQGFNPWDRQWYRNADTRCGRGTATGPMAFMPVYYTPGGFRWQASGPVKKFYDYFVEYPTGGQ